MKPTLCLLAHAVHENGGMEKAFAELILQLHDEIDITVVSSVLSTDLQPLVRWHRIRLPQRPFPLRFLGFFVFGALALRRVRTDLVCTLGAIVPNRTDIVSVHYCHAGRLEAVGSLANPGTPPLRRFYTRITRSMALLAERWCYRPSRVRSFAAVSNGLARELEKHYPGIPTAVVPNGVDTRRFAPSSTAKQSIRAELNTSPETVVALFVGGDWDRKGLALAIESVGHTKSLGIAVELWVVGRGSRESFLTPARAAGVDGQVRFFGPRSDIESFYQGADLFVLPSLYETFSLVCFEAAACGLPLVITKISGASELVGEDEAGIIVERNAKSIGSAIARLAADADLRDKLGTAARERAEPYTWSRSGRAFQEVVESLTAG